MKEHSYPKPERTNDSIIASRTYYKSGLINSWLPHAADTGLKFQPANLCQKFASGFCSMTRIQKTNRSMAEQLPKQMVKVLYNTLIQETHRSSSEIRTRSWNEPSRQNQDICTQDKLFTAVSTTGNSTWRIGLHKRATNNIWTLRRPARGS